MTLQCAVDACSLPTYCKGWCRGHYRTAAKFGDPLYVRPLSGPCAVPGPDGTLCGRPTASRSMCATHYMRWLTWGDPLDPPKAPAKPAPEPKVPRICDVDGCERKHWAKGCCRKHYKVLLAHGDPLYTPYRTAGSICTEQGCDEPASYARRCARHYQIHRYATTKDRLLAHCHTRRARVTTDATATEHDVARVRAMPCRACGDPGPSTVEHMIPLSRGGLHTVGNIAPLCMPCNSSKGNKLWVEWKYSGTPRASSVFN